MVKSVLRDQGFSDAIVERLPCKHQTTHRIAVIPGDGIGKEVVPEGLRVLQAAASAFDVRLDYQEFDDASADYYVKTGAMLPDGWFDELSRFDAIFFGAVGWPEVVPDHISLWGSLLQFRRHFDQYVNLRPVKVLAGVRSPLVGRDPGDIDFYVVRENTEVEYSSIGGKMFEGTDRETVIQETVMTRVGVGSDSPLRVHSRAEPAEEAPDVGDQEQRDLDHDAVLGRVGRDSCHSDFPTSPLTSTTSTWLGPPLCSCTGLVRRCVASNLFGDIFRPRTGAHRHRQGSRRAEHQPGAASPEPVRTGPRVGARHRGARDRQPARTIRTREHDARTPRRRTKAAAAIMTAIERCAGHRRRRADTGHGWRGNHRFAW